MGVLNKVILGFERPFWPADCEHFGWPAATEDRTGVFSNLAAHAVAPALVGWSSGRSARALEHLDDRTHQQWAMRSLRGLFGGSIPEPRYVRITRWAQDPWACGAYSHVPVGVDGTAHDRMAEPAGPTLRFAGEATHRIHPSTVHGAYASGLREAERLLSPGK
jgi:monoamine oxidase